MQTAALPRDEHARLRTLRALDVLDTPADPVLDELAHVASRICRAPIALISLVDAERQWFKARVGLDAPETPRDVAFCAHAIHGTDLFVVADSHRDLRFHDNPLVTGAPHVRFYAGAPLVVDGHGIGTLCAIDHVPRELDADQREALRALARAVVAHLQLRQTATALEAARAEAERLAGARARFLATMSHEIRTPMNGILGALDLLTALPLAGESAELAGLAQDGARQLMTLLDDVLDLSKLDAGAVELVAEDVDLAAELHAVVALMSPLARRKGVALGLEVAPGAAPRHVGDALRLRQVVANLVANALKFTAAGSVTIELKATGRAAGVEHVEIAVADTGIGIAADVLETLFAPFRQADAETARRYGGTGLGLAISRELAGLMGGTLTATSTPGVGSRFALAVALPLAKPGAPPIAMPTAMLPAAAAGLHVLLVDDEPVNRLLGRRTLERAGCVVTLATNGHDALALAAERRYDAVLMDFDMPDMDGAAATRALRAGEGPNRGTPVLALTANVLPADHEVCVTAGMCEVLTKPLHPAALMDALRRHAAPRPSRRTALAIG